MNTTKKRLRKILKSKQQTMSRLVNKKLIDKSIEQFKKTFRKSVPTLDLKNKTIKLGGKNNLLKGGVKEVPAGKYYKIPQLDGFLHSEKKILEFNKQNQAEEVATPTVVIGDERDELISKWNSEFNSGVVGDNSIYIGYPGDTSLPDTLVNQEGYNKTLMMKQTDESKSSKEEPTTTKIEGAVETSQSQEPQRETQEVVISSGPSEQVQEKIISETPTAAVESSEPEKAEKSTPSSELVIETVGNNIFVSKNKDLTGIVIRTNPESLFTSETANEFLQKLTNQIQAGYSAKKQQISSFDPARISPAFFGYEPRRQESSQTEVAVIPEQVSSSEERKETEVLETKPDETEPAKEAVIVEEGPPKEAVIVEEGPPKEEESVTVTDIDTPQSTQEETPEYVRQAEQARLDVEKEEALREIRRRAAEEAAEKARTISINKEKAERLRTISTPGRTSNKVQLGRRWTYKRPGIGGKKKQSRLQSRKFKNKNKNKNKNKK
jgi:hypothetical protein